MGKRSRRNKRNSKKGASKTAAEKPQQQHQGPAILQRIRHSDPKTRCAAITALCNYSSSSKLSTEILQAVVQQITCPDLHCGIAAAGCLGNYLCVDEEDESSTPSIDEGLTAGWLLIFVSRLEDCQRHLTELSTDTSAASNLLIYLELTERCLFCLVNLLENNPLAIRRLERQPNDCMSVLTKLLQTSYYHQILQKRTEKTEEMRQNIQTLAARCFHSVWDDNPAVIPYLSSSESAAKETLLAIHQTMNDNNSISHTARLHAVGAWMAAWLIVGSIEEVQGSISSEIMTLLQSQDSYCRCLSILLNALSWEITPQNVQNIKQAHAAYLSEEADHKLETEIVNSVNQKKEPARQIARRHKNNETMMKDDGVNDEQDTEKKGKLRQDRTNYGEQWEATAQNEWYNIARPLQLALEIVANLTSAQQPEAYDGDMMEDVGLADDLSRLLIESQLPDKILELFRKLLSSSWYGTETIESLPESIRESASDLQCKVTVCLSHCLANLQQSWSTPENLWSDLRAACAVNGAAQESVASTMVVALRSRESIRMQIQAADLDHLLSLLTSSAGQNRPVLVRDVVCMLGILCSEETHSAEVNERVCKALLQITTNQGDKPSAMVLAEVLNALMDIYGDDDSHPMIFDSLGVLGHFQLLLPVLKQRISVEELPSSATNADEIEQWKEIAVNAARFIQYKKGHGD